MPPSTNASYVGRLAPPGSPNTTSTPSALRHSMTASTARMRFAPCCSWRGEDERPREGGRIPASLAPLGAGAIPLQVQRLASLGGAHEDAHARDAARQPAQIHRRAPQRPSAQITDLVAVDGDRQATDPVAPRRAQVDRERPSAGARAAGKGDAG